MSYGLIGGMFNLMANIMDGKIKSVGVGIVFKYDLGRFFKW